MHTHNIEQSNETAVAMAHASRAVSPSLFISLSLSSPLSLSFSVCKYQRIGLTKATLNAKWCHREGMEEKRNKRMAKTTTKRNEMKLLFRIDFIHPIRSSSNWETRRSVIDATTNVIESDRFFQDVVFVETTFVNVFFFRFLHDEKSALDQLEKIRMKTKKC